MMKRLFVLVFLFVSAITFGQRKSGLLLHGGTGDISAELKSLYGAEIDRGKIDYLFNAAVGYRFVIQPQSRLFYNIDVNAGLKSWNSDYYDSNRYKYLLSPVSHVNTQFYHLSIGGAANYTLLENLSIGAGIEPVYYFYQDGEDNSISPGFDIPLTGKIGFDLKKFSLEFSYKHGLCNLMNTEYIKFGKMRDYTFSVFIPF
ncbi:hypothetical protein Barb6_02518 [Bacteroidales bacterium Barb6]|nr:hypothetical protein Barb6_02518 [Bacteroidales bacterium Barb6]